MVKAVYLEQDKTNECIEMCENAIKLGRAHNAERTLIARFDFYMFLFIEFGNFCTKKFLN